MNTNEKLWWLAVDWFEACEISTTHGFAADQHWLYLLLWAAPSEYSERVLQPENPLLAQAKKVAAELVEVFSPAGTIRG